MHGSAPLGTAALWNWWYNPESVAHTSVDVCCMALRWRVLPRSRCGRAAVVLICIVVYLGKWSLQHIFVIDVCVNFVKCHLFWFFQCLYWWYVFSVLTVFLVNLFLIKKKKAFLLHMPSSMELRVICLCTCQGYTMCDKDPKCDTNITKVGNVKGVGPIPLVNSSFWHMGYLNDVLFWIESVLSMKFCQHWHEALGLWA